MNIMRNGKIVRLAAGVEPARATAGCCQPQSACCADSTSRRSRRSF